MDDSKVCYAVNNLVLKILMSAYKSVLFKRKQKIAEPHFLAVHTYINIYYYKLKMALEKLL